MILKGDGWNNHEESFEETLRREMLAADERLDLFKKDMTSIISEEFTFI